MPRLRAILLSLALLPGLLLAGAARAGAGLDRSQLRLVFDEGFTTLDLRSPAHPDGRWDTKFATGDRTLPNNAELEIYVDRDFKGLGIDPFSVKNGVLTITARPAPESLRSKLGGLRYTSGLLTSEHSFAQTYGYFEVRARLPAGKGLWPAFWLLPLSKEWPPEIDVFEVLGHDPRLVYMTIHSTKMPTRGYPVPVPDTSEDFHDYGVLWGHDQIVWYFDGVERARARTPDDMHKPMYMLINLAVGGTWPGAPDAVTRFPAEMQVARVRAYATPETIPAVPLR
jgi:serralysin